jgi:hypothetical protein
MAKVKSNTGFRNGKLFCFNCGASYDMQLPQPVDMAAGIMKTFGKSHRDCKPVWEAPEPNMSQSEKQRAKWWADHGERGMSSEAIYNMLAEKKISNNITHPSDPDDFRRCYLLLKAVPEWRIKMDAMREVSPVWNNLVDNWDKLTEMLETALNTKEKKAPEMYELMKSIGC